MSIWHFTFKSVLFYALKYTFDLPFLKNKTIAKNITTIVIWKITGNKHMNNSRSLFQLGRALPNFTMIYRISRKINRQITIISACVALSIPAVPN